MSEIIDPSILPMDGAGPTMELGQERAATLEIAGNPEAQLERRLEAFEDLIDSEVGDTNLVRARNLEREFGMRQLFLKFEGGNPTGTQKDRIAFAQTMDAMRRGFDTITLATCGNYGAATAFAASLCGLRCVVFMPVGYHSKRSAEMEKFGAVIYREGRDYEASVIISSQRAQEEGWYDANPGGENTVLQLNGYGGISYEIYDELRDAPAMIAAPVSNGTTLAGVHRGFLSLFRRGKTSRLPRFVAGSTYKKNPIVRAFIKNLPRCEDLKPETIRETAINEPLINWHAIDGNHALEALRQTEGYAADVSDKQMRTLSNLILKKEGIHVLPASTAGLAAMLNLHAKQPLINDRYVAILTGRKE